MVPENCQMHAEECYHQTVAFHPTVHLQHRQVQSKEDIHCVLESKLECKFSQNSKYSKFLFTLHQLLN